MTAKGYRTSLSDFMCSGVERIVERRFMVISFLYCYYRSTQTNGIIHGEKNDESGKRWNKKDDFLTLYIYLGFFLVS